MSVPSDRVILQQVSDGDARAFGTVWDRHHQRVFAHLLVSGLSPHDADELTGTAFLELWRKRRTVRYVDDSVLPWLLVTARNVARNAERARRRYRAVLDRLPSPSAVPDPAETVQARNDPRVKFARDVLQAARPEDQKLVALTAIEGFTIAEAAQALGVKESTARMRLSRLRERLHTEVRTAISIEGSLL